MKILYEGAMAVVGIVMASLILGLWGTVMIVVGIIMIKAITSIKKETRNERL